MMIAGASAHFSEGISKMGSGPARETKGIGIDRLVTRLFRKKWNELHSAEPFRDPRLKYPGVYLLAYTKRRLCDKQVDIRDVFYVGMSNAAGGVQARLKQFKAGVEKNGLHSAARRFYREHCGGRPFSRANTRKRFYFVALTIPCVSEKAAAQSDDLKKIGHIACLEYYAIARVVAKTGQKPILNKYGTLGSD